MGQDQRPGPMGRYVVRRMKREEMDVAIRWAAAEGWNPGLSDADCFYTADPNGFFIGTLDDEPAATLSAVAYDDGFGFLGFYIVRPELRGRGHGLEIWRAGMAYLGSRNIGLDGVLAQQDNYRKSGFQLTYYNARYEGVGGGQVPPGVVALAEVPFAELVAFDRMMFGAARAAFLERWVAQPHAVGRAVRRAGDLAGYGVIRRCGRGFKIGPLFAADERDAERLFQALAAEAPDQPIFLDIPEVNRAAQALVKRHRMTPVFQTARMYSKQAPALPLAQIFGVTSFELG
jgi:ribosomal protein S18 acetylase RimI-like enzyme